MYYNKELEDNLPQDLKKDLTAYKKINPNIFTDEWEAASYNLTGTLHAICACKKYAHLAQYINERYLYSNSWWNEL